MASHVKNKERHRFYYYVKNPAISYTSFIQRCGNNKHKLTKELMEKLIMTPVVKNNSIVDANGRECTTCKEYKLREYYKNYTSANMSNCKQCMTKRVKRKPIVLDEIIYSKKSLYKSPFRFWSRKWKKMTVREIWELEWIDPKYYQNIMNRLLVWSDVEKTINRFISYNNDASNMKVSKTLKNT